ncbi:phospholipase C [Malassezia vespertilionis]|uniref:Phospholipase C n=1 Tax=Malassezia vespertilionis TaxID=2020962 RepID=A0A2N1J7J2_9BASI|nr:phospholipase C [Malassezia vespertilionis]PKI82521.1 hypothetical protein MVES_003562 [Malassezia vespertilionis]WFD08636.1 phospholipase C [Malassezia vespertilionis]
MRSVFWQLCIASVLVAECAASREDGLKNIKHIVLFMQENRSFDHYFGTMAGVRGFQDPNVHVSKNSKKNVFHQPVNHSAKEEPAPKGVVELLPWHLNYQGGDWNEKTQCMLAGTNDWRENHAAWNEGEIDQWVVANTPYSIGYFRREDLPIQYSLAGNFTVGDSYYESIISSTDPNRVSWFSGTINVNGSVTGGNGHRMGGPVIDNNVDPKCLTADDGSPFSCRPLRWKTVPEYLYESSISFQVYQDFDNFGDDTLVEWAQYQEAAKHKEQLAKQAVSFPGLDKFYEDAYNGNLPEVSYIVAPQDLSEHPPYMPKDGAWLQRKVAEAVMHGKDWDSTALIVSYDETGGWADHVISPLPPKDAQGEWIIDPYDKSKGWVPTGPGFRLPFYVISPWTRNGGVFTEHCSHESQILFLEKWAKAVGKPFHTKDMNPWRREHMSDLVKVFDFSSHDTSTLELESVPKASQDPITKQYNGASVCQARFLWDVQPKVPYGEQDEHEALRVEPGYKPTRGDLSEGRYLTMEADGFALSHKDNRLGTGRAHHNHNGEHYRFVLHWKGTDPKDNRFLIATDSEHPMYITKGLKLSKKAHKGALFAIHDKGNGEGYTVTEVGTSKQMSITKDGSVAHANYATFIIYSVTQ